MEEADWLLHHLHSLQDQEHAHFDSDVTTDVPLSGYPSLFGMAARYGDGTV